MQATIPEYNHGRAAARLRPWLLMVCVVLGLLTSACASTSSAGPVASATPSATATLTPSATATLTPSATATLTPSATATLTPSATATFQAAPPPATAAPPAATAAPPPATPVPPAATAGVGPDGCVLSAALVADVTIPPGTTLQPGAPFTKVWRIRNTGTCQWSADYGFISIEGDQLSSITGLSNIPPAAPGESIDLAVGMQAPQTAGSYASVWQLQSSNGVPFGWFAVSITVADQATPTAAPTAAAATATAIPPVADCILRSTFVSDRTEPPGTVRAPGSAFTAIWQFRNDGTCAWDPSYRLVFTSGRRLGGAEHIDMPVTNPGAIANVELRLVAPTEPGSYTGTWRLQASDGAILGEYAVTVIVQAAPTKVPVSSTWGGAWECQIVGAAACGVIELTQQAGRVDGSWPDGMLSGRTSASGDVLSGAWQQGKQRGSFRLQLAPDGQSWVGERQPSHQTWCGWRAGSPRPAACGG